MSAAPSGSGVAVLWSAFGYYHFDRYPESFRQELRYAREYVPIDPGNPEELFALQYYAWHADGGDDIIISPGYGSAPALELDPDDYKVLDAR